VSPNPSTERFLGARPVADAPVDALLARADDLARRWATALIAARPLAEMAGVPLGDLARQAPALCEQLSRALGSDAELEQLLAAAVEGDRGRAAQGRPGALAAWLAPARDVSWAVRDVEALRAVIWESALGELREPTATQVAELSDRLASICAALLAALLDQHELAGGAVATPSAPPAPGRERVLYSSRRMSPGGRQVVVIDERDEVAGSPARGREAPAAGSGATPSYPGARAPRETAPDRGDGSRPGHTAPRPRPWDTPLEAASRAAGAGLQDPTSQRAAPDGGDAVMRVMRGPGAPVDERA